MAGAMGVLATRSLAAHPIEVCCELVEDCQTTSSKYVSSDQPPPMEGHFFYPSAPILLAFCPESSVEFASTRTTALISTCRDHWGTICTTYNFRDIVQAALKLLWLGLQSGAHSLESAVSALLRAICRTWMLIPADIQQFIPLQWMKPAALGFLLYYSSHWLPFLPHAVLALLTAITMFMPCTLFGQSVIFSKLVVISLVICGQCLVLGPGFDLEPDRMWAICTLLVRLAATCLSLQLFTLLVPNWSTNSARAWVTIKSALFMCFYRQQRWFWLLFMGVQKLQLLCILHSQAAAAKPPQQPPHNVARPPSSEPLLKRPSCQTPHSSSHSPPTPPHHQLRTQQNSHSQLTAMASSLLAIACVLYVPPGELFWSPLMPEGAKWIVTWLLHVFSLGLAVMVAGVCIRLLNQRASHHSSSTSSTAEGQLSWKWTFAAVVVMFFAMPALLPAALKPSGLEGDGGQGAAVTYLVMKTVSMLDCVVATMATLRSVAIG